MLKKLLILICGVAFLTLVVFVINNSGASNSNEEDYQLVDALRAGVHFDVKNMGYQQYYDDSPVGFEIELAELLAKYIYGESTLLELTSVSTKTAKYYLNDKTIDCIIATQPLPSLESKEYKYSKPYYTDYVELYSKDTILSLNNLEGKTIAVITDSYAKSALESLLTSSKINASLVTYESYDDGLHAVQIGKTDAFCGNRAFVATTTLKRFTVTTCEYAIMVRSSDSGLLSKLNIALDAITNSGELKALQEKYKK